MKREDFTKACELDTKIEDKKDHIARVKRAITDLKIDGTAKANVLFEDTSGCSRSVIKLTFCPLKTMEGELKLAEQDLRTLNGQFAKL